MDINVWNVGMTYNDTSAMTHYTIGVIEDDIWTRPMSDAGYREGAVYESTLL